MKLIPLSQGKFAMVDDADFEAVNAFKWYAKANRSSGWYAARNVGKPDGTRTTQKLHQFLMPGVSMIDHKDGDKLNYRRDNLRPCTLSQNQWNARKRRGTSKFKGVTWFSPTRKWMARICFEGNPYSLGCFFSEIDAAKAYDAAARKFFGEFARPNFILDNP